MKHKIAHLLGWNYGRPDAFYDGDKLMMSFLCSGCGKRSNIFHCDNIIDRELETCVGCIAKTENSSTHAPNCSKSNFKEIFTH